ncbi:DEAD/DEAH box helicase family protein [Neptuniibacter sp.]|uniref:DEAD/DEAH box helicase family protein n=1 Tax=Neptuniibacter sp. TaxID=1962643 RepID=UPI0026072760|nr:DEAD/DEAH box helicase family protein [Neptuniibacter sp.]MCP4595396.1 DEAD/DEAH box helicase family protein [Neptuniibacter sp.]
MNPIHYKLTDSQYISDLNLQVNPDSYLTHLCADTGMGKSTWVIDYLSQQGNTLFVVPQLAQIKQLEHKYSDRKDIEFIYGGNTELSDYPSNIVCTYDQLRAIQSKIHSHHYMLVVDEVHKLYQAASYRTEAVSQIVDAIMEEGFNNVLTMSATFTPELVPYRIDSWLEVSRNTAIDRHIELELYSDLYSMEEHVISNIDSSEQGPTVVRINSKKDIIAYQQVLESKGLNCLAVNRDLQATEAVSTMLKTESLDGYDVVLTTSLLDEAINIQDEVINELIVFNNQIHPEELKQFVGRFRNCNPKVRLCLAKYLLTGKAKDLNQAMKSNACVVSAAEQLAEVILMECDALQAVRKANETLKALFGFEPLRLNYGKIAANDAGAMAKLYQADINHCYHSLTTLQNAMKRIFHHMEWEVKEVDCGRNCKDAAAFDAAYDAITDDWYGALNNCKSAVSQEISKQKNAGVSALNSNEVLATCSKRFSPESLELGILQNWWQLHTEVMPDLWEAFDAIEQDRAVKIWQFHNSARSNLYIEPLLLQLKQLPIGTVMTLAEARECVLSSLRQVSKQYPNFKDLIASSSLPGVTVKRNNHFDVTDRYVRFIFREYTATRPVRSNNKDRIVFNGIGPYGYRYRIVESGIDTKKKKQVKRLRRIKPAA